MLFRSVSFGCCGCLCGGGGSDDDDTSAWGHAGADGGIRIIWPGLTRYYPDTNTADE